MKLEYKSLLWRLLAGIALLGVFAFFKPKFLFPGLLERVLWVFIPLLVITVFVNLPWKLFMKKAKNHKATVRMLKLFYSIASKPRKLVSVIFQTVLILYLIILVMQEYVSFTFPNYYVLGLVVVFGVLAALFPEPKAKENKQKRTRFDTALIITLSVVAVILIFIKTKDLGRISYLISLISGALVFLLGLVVFDEEDVEEKTPDISVSAKNFFWFILVIIILSSVLSFFIGLDSFRIVSGAIFSLFIPGFILSYSFFEKNRIEALERIALSFALSISVVPLFVFYLNLLGMPINTWSVSLTILFICVLGYVIYKKKKTIAKIFCKHKKHRKK